MNADATASRTIAPLLLCHRGCGTPQPIDRLGHATTQRRWSQGGLLSVRTACSAHRAARAGTIDDDGRLTRGIRPYAPCQFSRESDSRWSQSARAAGKRGSSLSLNNHTTLLRFNLCSAFLFLRVFFGPALRVYMYQSFFFSDGSS